MKHLWLFILALGRFKASHIVQKLTSQFYPLSWPPLSEMRFVYISTQYEYFKYNSEQGQSDCNAGLGNESTDLRKRKCGLGEFNSGDRYSFTIVGRKRGGGL